MFLSGCVHHTGHFGLKKRAIVCVCTSGMSKSAKV